MSGYLLLCEGVCGVFVAVSGFARVCASVHEYLCVSVRKYARMCTGVEDVRGCVA